MDYLKPQNSGHMLKWLLLFTAVLPFLFFANDAEAKPDWCVQELEKKDDRVVVLHNPACDLRMLARLYPQKDDAGNALPMQVQLRSIYAANQTRMVDGEKIRYTVMRGCVAPGKPSKDADAEELALCPNGLMNYFSAPSSDNAAKIEVPFARKLTIAEKNLKLAEDACRELQSKDSFSKEGKAAATRCRVQFPEMVFDGSAKKEASDTNSEAESSALKRVFELEAELAKLRDEKPVLRAESKDGRVVLFWVLVLLAGACAVLTILLIKKSRQAKELAETNKSMFRDRHTFQREAQVRARKEAFESGKLALADQKAQVEKDLKDAWNDLLAKQQRQIAALESEKKELEIRINDFRDSVLPPSFADGDKDREAKQLEIIDEQAAKIRGYKNEIGGLEQQNAELRSELAVLIERTVILEKDAVETQTLMKRARQEKAALEIRIAEAASKLTERNADNARLAQQLSQKESERACFAQRSTEQAETIAVLEKRLEALLEASKMQSNFPSWRTDKLGQTIPFGALDDEKTKKVYGAIGLPEEEAAAPRMNRGDSSESENRDDASNLHARGEHKVEAVGGGRRNEELGNEVNIPSLDPPRIPLDLDPDEDGFQALQKWDYNAENFWYSLATLMGEKLRLPKSVLATKDRQTIIAAFTDRMDELCRVRLQAEEESKKQSGEYAISEEDDVTLVNDEPDEVRRLLSSEVRAVRETEESVSGRSAMLTYALDLERANRHLAREVLGSLPEEQLLLLANALFHAISETVKKTGQLEYPVTGTSDLFALHNVLMMPITSDYGFQMPSILQKLSGNGVPRVYHAMHDAFGSFSVGTRSEAVKHNPTMRPPAGVPHDQNSTPPVDHSQVKSRAAICPPPGEESGGSGSVS